MQRARLMKIAAGSGKQKCKELTVDFVEPALQARNSTDVLARVENGNRAGSHFVTSYEGAFNAQ
ncbi:hypothetical protein SLEP1_g48772 [Rubroshorea leprosula]|uniref:Uncharacterized protein n=1 Tax=Rubroshorea leprosula TaxID=152421 RepID=A0AAV5LUW6_9ROSI|nr:hypothetical protein SLEP1_g48772 [Rubroshorea leprosula]